MQIPIQLSFLLFTFEFRKHHLNVYSRVLKAVLLYSIWLNLTALWEVVMQNCGCTWQLGRVCSKKAGAACTARKQLPFSVLVWHFLPVPVCDFYHGSTLGTQHCFPLRFSYLLHWAQANTYCSLIELLRVSSASLMIPCVCALWLL